MKFGSRSGGKFIVLGEVNIVVTALKRNIRLVKFCLNHSQFIIGL